ncbi:MAG: hypothetical protein MZV70_42935 [Desulfobacterales bacterium]|nr:hypothetical protein [Desulfobacterales bacterium]
MSQPAWSSATRKRGVRGAHLLRTVDAVSFPAGAVSRLVGRGNRGCMAGRLRRPCHHRCRRARCTDARRPGAGSRLSAARIVVRADRAGRCPRRRVAGALAPVGCLARRFLEVVLLRALKWLPIGLVSGAIILVRQRAREIAAQLHESEVTRLQLDQQRVATELQVPAVSDRAAFPVQHARDHTSPVPDRPLAWPRDARRLHSLPGNPRCRKCARAKRRSDGRST